MVYLIGLLTAVLVLAAGSMCAASAGLVLRGYEVARPFVRWASVVPYVLWGGGLVFLCLGRLEWTDWVHLFWTAQIPLVGSFLVSGLLLCRVWGDDVEVLRPGAGRGIPRAPWIFLATLTTLALTALALQIAIPEDRPSPRETGQPVARLVELAAWGFGGPLPDYLVARTPFEVERGVGHLMREVTVPMGILLIAAWLWIGFVALALAGRLLRPQKLRIAAYLVVPILVGLAFFAGLDPIRPVWSGFDGRFFLPFGARDTGIWVSDPAVMRSFGPVLFTALLAAVALLAAQVAQRRSR